MNRQRSGASADRLRLRRSGTLGQEVCGSSARQAVTNEQSRNKEHAGHEKTVIEQHDQIESEPAHPVGIAEIGVIDDRVVQHHQQRDKAARAVDWNASFQSTARAALSRCWWCCTTLSSITPISAMPTGCAGSDSIWSCCSMTVFSWPACSLFLDCSFVTAWRAEDPQTSWPSVPDLLNRSLSADALDLWRFIPGGAG